jgi:tetratricopeptide (TPR) repeat protein
LLGQLLELDAFAVQAALRRLDDFLVPGGPQTVRFRHGLLRDAAYETLPYRRRRELHGRAAGLIERTAGARAEDQAELLALHYHAARRWPETWRWARVAADQSLRRAAPVEAAGFLSRALDAGRALPATPSSELAGVAERLGDAARLGGRPEAAAAAYGEARRRMRGDAVAEAKLCLKTGRLGDRSRHVSQSLRWYTRGLHTLEALGDDPAAVRVRAQLTLAHGATRLRAGRLKECVPLLRAALDGAAAIGDKPTLAHGYFLIFAALSDLGDPEADAFRELPLPIYQELGDHAGQAMVLNNLGIDAYYRAHWDEAVDLYERSRVASEHIGDAIESATALNNIAEIRSDQGRFEEAEELLREALQTFRASGFGVGEGIVWSNLGRLAARRGDLDGARDRLARARTVLESIGSDQLTLEVDAREAERMLFAGDRAGALRLAGAIRLRLQQIGEVPTLMAMLQRMAGYAKLQSGAPEEARARFGESAALARRADAPYEEALALEALGRMGDEEAAAAAAAVFTRLGVVATAPTPLPV